MSLDKFLTGLQGEQEKSAGVAATVEAAAGYKPDEVAQYNRIAKITQLDPLAMADDPLLRAEGEKRAKLSTIDFDSLIQTHPHTANALGDLPTASLVHDDVGGMQLLEGAFGAYTRASSAVASAIPATLGGALGSVRATNEVFLRPYTRAGAKAIGVSDPGKAVSDWLGRLQASMTQATERLTPQAGGDIEAGVYSGLRSFGQQVGAIGGALATGGVAGIVPRTLAFMTVPLFGEEYARAEEKGKAPIAAAAYAGAQTGVELLTELGPTGALLRSAKVGAPFFKGILKNAPEFLVKEIGGEQVATHWQDLNAWVALNPEKTLDTYIAERPSAAVQTLVATLVAGGGIIATSKVLQRLTGEDDKARAAEALHIDLTILSQAAADVKLRERDPERMQEFMRTMAEDADVTELHVDAKTLKEALLQTPVEVQQQFAASLPAVAAQLEEAAATDSTIRIPVADYATRVSGTELDAVLLPNMKAEPEGLTYAQTQEYYAQQAEGMQQAAADIEEEQAQNADYQTDVQNVRQQVLDQLTTAGRYRPEVNEKLADLRKAWYVTRAADLGMTPSELYAQFPSLTVGPEQMAQGEVLAQAQPQTETPEFKAWFGESKVVNAEGVPQVVYHGSTRGGITNATVQTSFFTSSREVADTYSRDGAGEAPSVQELYLRMDNPLEVDAKGEEWMRVEFEGKRYTTDTLAVEAKRRGHDGLIVRNVVDNVADEELPPADIYVTLGKKGQVKSATRNVGAFDPNDPSILRQASSAYGYGYRAREAARKATPEDLSTANVKNLLRKTDWTILTAENPAAKQLSEEDNAARMAELKADLDAQGLQYTEVKGKYGGNEENSIAIFGITRAQASELGQKYGQESVLTRDGLVYPDGTVNPARKVASFAKAPEDFYTRVPSTGAAFSVDIDFDHRLPLPEGERVGEVDVEGAHFSQQHRPVLNGAAYGRGLRGAEARRLAEPGVDSRIKNRIYFYVDEGKGVFPEGGVGNARHDVTLTNLYDGAKNPLRLPADDMNTFEAAVLDAGFDGYYIEEAFTRQGAAVLLGDATKAVQVDLPEEGKLFQSAFHGTPFIFDKFSLAHVGRGEGAQAYGWGLYFTESRAVADWYKQKLAGGTFHTKSGGVFDARTSLKNVNVRAVLNKTDGDIDAALARAEQAVASIPGTQGGEAAQADITTLNQLKAEGGITRPAGAVYGVEIPDEEDYLLWDKPLTEQSEKVKAALYASGYSPAADEMTGKELYQDTADSLAGGPETENPDELASKLFNSLGIRGVKYLDGASRDRGEAPSYNYVVFDEEAVRILETYQQAARGKYDVASAVSTIEAIKKPSSKTLETWASDNELVLEIEQLPKDAFGDREWTIELWAPDGYAWKSSGAQVATLPGHGEYGKPDWQKVAEAAKAELQYGVEPLEEEGYAQAEGAPKGFFNPATFTTGLLKDADLSTYLHETGHFFLEAEAALAAQPNAPQKVKDDFAKALNWMGVADVQTWQAMTLEEKRPYHEKYARGFEAYLMEGKAPSAELKSMFQTFASWLKHLYQSLRNLNVELSDEVRGVFDRMLASEAAITEQEQVRRYEALLTEGATDEEAASYLLLGEQATIDAIETLQRRSIKDMKWVSGARSRALKAAQREAASKRKVVREEVTAEVMAEQVNKARTFLRKGETVDEATGDLIKAETGFRLDNAALAEMFPETMLSRPDLSALRGMTRNDGLHPDMVATMFGYQSGKALIHDLITGENAGEKINGITDQRMLERHGDLYDDRAIAAAADEAVHNDARAKFMATGLKMAMKSALPVAQIKRAAKEAAQAAIASRRLDQIKPAQYTAAETRANKAAIKAAPKDPQEAQRAQRSALLNNQLAREALNAQEEIRKGIARLNRLQRSGAQGAMRGDYLDQLNALLARYDLRTSVKAIPAERQELRTWLAEKGDAIDAVAPDVPEWVLNEANRRSYKELTLEEFRGLLDAVKGLELLARREEHQYQAIRDMKFGEERRAVLDRIKEFHPEAFDLNGEPEGLSPKFVKSLGDKATDASNKFLGEFLNAENIINLLEDGQFGIVNESLFGRMSKAADWKATRLEAIHKKLSPLLQQYSYLERQAFGKADITTGIVPGEAMTRENVLVVALLHGNPEGRERLANYGWNEEHQQKLINLLDERDVKLANGIWELFDEDLWPELEALNKRTRGKAPPKVTAMTHTANGGMLRGGYFRLKYDTHLDARAQHYDEMEGIKALAGGTLGRSARTAQGTSAERKQGVTMRPRLDLGVFAETVAETVHDLAYREAALDTMRLLNDKGLRSTVITVAGEPAYLALLRRVREVAAPPRNPSGFIESTLAHARKNTIVTLMSGVSTALLNVTGFFPAASRVNAGRLVKEIGLFYSPKMTEKYEQAITLSEYMRNRSQSFERDLQDEIKKLTVDRSYVPLPDTGTFLILMATVDKGVSVPVWHAAFRDGLEKFDNDQQRAVDYADHIVRQTQGTGRAVDMAAIMSGHGGYGQLKKTFTMFYSYFNAQLGMLVRTGAVNKHLAKRNPTLAAAQFTKDFLLIWAIPAILTLLAKEAASGGEEDEEKRMSKIIWAMASYGLGMVPLLRDIAPLYAGLMDKNIPQYGFKLSPAQFYFEAPAKAVTSVGDILAGEGDDKDLRNVIMGGSVTIGLPGKLIADTTLGTKAVIEGEAGPQAILLGPPKK